MLTHHFTIIKFFCKKQKKTHFRARRASNMVDQLPASSNFPHIIFLILNENLTPTYQYSSRIFVFQNCKNFHDFQFFKQNFAKSFKIRKENARFFKKDLRIKQKNARMHFFRARRTFYTYVRRPT